MSKHTPIYEEHLKLGAKMVPFAGWDMPIQYKGLTDEHKAVRESAGIFDVSHMGVFQIEGTEAEGFLNYLTPSNTGKLENMQATYSLFLTDEGTIVDDIIIYKFNSEKFFLVVNAANLEKDKSWIQKNLKSGAEFTDLSEGFALLALQGRNAEKIIQKATGTDLSNVGTFRMAEVNSENFGELLFARTGYTGEDGFEIFVSAEKAPAIWNAILEAGKEFNIQPIGLGARDTLRLEMKYTLYGHEITDKTNALEAGLRWVVKLKKPCDFIGKNALLKIRDEGLKRKLVGFKMIDKGIPRDGYALKADGKEIGIVTSGTFSPSLKEPVGIGYVVTEFADIGTKFSVDIRGKERQAEVVKTPFYTRPY